MEETTYLHIVLLLIIITNFKVYIFIAILIFAFELPCSSLSVNFPHCYWGRITVSYRLKLVPFSQNHFSLFDAQFALTW